MQITSRADFATFTLIPRLAHRGINAHMGVLVRLPNPIIMAGPRDGAYADDRPWLSNLVGAPCHDERALWASWCRLSAVQRLAWAVLATAPGGALPVRGPSLAFFLTVDLLRMQAMGQAPLPG